MGSVMWLVTGSVLELVLGTLMCLIMVSFSFSHYTDEMSQGSYVSKIAQSSEILAVSQGRKWVRSWYRGQLQSQNSLFVSKSLN